MSDLTVDKTEEKTGDGALQTVQDSPPAAPYRDQKFANRVFNWLNYCGFGFLTNSALSLAITYNVMPTDAAQNGINKLAEGIKPVAGGWDKLKKLVGLGKEIDKATRDAHLNARARSMAEIFCMFIAGTLVLLPMKWMEDSKKAIVDRIDRWKNPEYHEHCKEHGVEPEKLPHENEEKQGWSKLLWARVAGMAAVLGVDGVIQSFNNKRHTQGKWNMDTAEWKLGNLAYDKLPKSITEKFIDFFSAHDVNISKIQPQMREALEKTVGADPKRMIFAEQARFFSKEVSLTAIMAGIIYALSKTGVTSSVLNALGIKKAKEQHQAIDDMLPEVPFMPVTRGDVDFGDVEITDKKQSLNPENFRKSRDKEIAASADGYAGKYLNSSPAVEHLSL